MNPEKRNALILLLGFLAIVGYNFFLTTKIQDTEGQLEELKMLSAVKQPTKKNNIVLNKFKVPIMKYCDAENPKYSISFYDGEQFEILNANKESIKGKYTLDNNTVILAIGENSQLSLFIKSWDGEFKISEFSLDGRSFITSSCKTEEQEKLELEKMEQERLAQIKEQQLAEEKLAAEKAEQEKIARRKVEEAEKLAQEIAEQERQQKIKQQQQLQLEEEERLKKEKEKQALEATPLPVPVPVPATATETTPAPVVIPELPKTEETANPIISE